jgi:hypothetical protein
MMRHALAPLAATLLLGVTGARPAAADVPGNRVTWVIHHLQNNPDDTTTDGTARYYDVISRIRSAAGHSFYPQGVGITQNYKDGLIGVDIRTHHDKRLVVLFINPQSLYISGFQAKDGNVYYFPDASPEVKHELGSYASSVGKPAIGLPLKGTWSEWEYLTGNEHFPDYNMLLVAGYASSLGSITVNTVSGSAQGIAYAMLYLDPAYSQALRYTVYRDNVGRVMHDLFAKGPVYTPAALEMRANTTRINNWLHDVAYDNFVKASPVWTSSMNFTIGPENGKFTSFSSVEKKMRMFAPGLR